MKRISLFAGFVLSLMMVSMLGSCGRSALDLPLVEKVVEEDKEKKEEVVPPKDEPQKDPFLPQDEVVNPSEGQPSDDEKKDDKDNVVPEQYEIVTRLSARWKSDAEYQTKFDYHRLSYLKDNQFFTPQYLSEFVTFYVMPVGGSSEYVLDSKDLQKLAITKIEAKEEGKGIEILFSYNGQSSSQKIALSFDKNKYYAGQLSQNNNVISTLYSTGVANLIDLYVSRILSYDETRYYVTNVGAAFLLSDGVVSFNVAFAPIGNGDLTLATINVVVKGFKPIEQLSQEIRANVVDTDFNDYVRKYAGNERMLSTSIPKMMIDKVRYYVKRGNKSVELSLGDNTLTYREGLEYADIFLKETKFNFKTIVEKADSYDVVVTLTSNEPYFSHDLHIHVPQKS